MSLALYRKYRPSTFADVIGQEHVTTPLSNALTSGQIHHAYLFSGPRGCGKTSSARIMARSLNCEKGPTPNPCGVCQSCKDLVANRVNCSILVHEKTNDHMYDHTKGARWLGTPLELNLEFLRNFAG